MKTKLYCFNHLDKVIHWFFGPRILDLLDAGKVKRVEPRAMCRLCDEDAVVEIEDE